MPLDVRHETTAAFAAFQERFDALTNEQDKRVCWETFNGELYTLGVTMWATGINNLTTDNIGPFIDRVLMLEAWPDLSRNELDKMFRPFIGACTNTSPETRAAWLKRFKHRL